MRDRRSSVAVLGAIWRGSWLGRLIVTAIAIASLLLLAVPVRDDAARLMMGKLQLRGPFVRWAALQLLPSMYNFTNVVRLETPGSEIPVETFWLNHYPMRVLTYMRRIELARYPATLTTQTRFGRLSVATRCAITPHDDGSDVVCTPLP